MSKHDDPAHQDELTRFVAHVTQQIANSEVLSRAGVEILVSDEALQSESRGELKTASVAGGCNCPPDQRCVRVFPGGRRVCVPR